MTDQRKARASKLMGGALVVFVAVLVVWFSMTSNPEPTVGVGEASSSIGIARPELVFALQRFDQHLRDVIESQIAPVDAPLLIHSGESGAVLHPKAHSTDSGVKRMRPLRYSLAASFLHGSLMTSTLARHYLLNLAGRSPDTDDIAELESLVKVCNARYDSLIEAHAIAAQYEMIALIESGGGTVRVSESHVGSEKALRALARAYAQARGGELGVEESEFQRLANGPPQVMRAGENCLVHKNQVYRQGDFALLPESDKRFTDLKYFALENLSLVINWFVSKGYATFGENLISEVERLETITPLEMRSWRSSR